MNGYQEEIDWEMYDKECDKLSDTLLFNLMYGMGEVSSSLDAPPTFTPHEYTSRWELDIDNRFNPVYRLKKD